jgi:hypothetical protein
MNTIAIVADGVVLDVELRRDATGRPFARARESSGKKSFLGFGVDEAECFEDLLSTVHRVYPEAIQKVTEASTKKPPRRSLTSAPPRRRSLSKVTKGRDVGR